MQHQHGPDPWRWTALCRNEARLLENVFRAACSTPFFQSIVFKSQEVALANWGLIEASYIRKIRLPSDLLTAPSLLSHSLQSINPFRELDSGTS